MLIWTRFCHVTVSNALWEDLLIFAQYMNLRHSAINVIYLPLLYFWENKNRILGSMFNTILGRKLQKHWS